MPLAKGTRVRARSHASAAAGRRLVVPGDNPTNAMAAGRGLCLSTAADVARFFAQLAPNAKRSLLSAASRREMTRKQWRNPHSTLEGYYGLGIMSGTTAGWDWFGHGGGFQGYISRTCVIPACELAITILTNAADGMAGLWLDGAMHILRAFESARRAEAPRPRLDRALVGHVRGASIWCRSATSCWPPTPQLLNPFMDAAEIEVTGRDTGRSCWRADSTAMARRCAACATSAARSATSGSREVI